MELPQTPVDNTPVVLSHDNKLVVYRAATELENLACDLRRHIDKQTFKVINRATILQLIGHQVNRLVAATGHTVDIQLETERDNAFLRKVIDENRELETRLAMKMQLADVGPAFMRIRDTINAWWKKLGFCLCDVSMQHPQHVTVVFRPFLETHMGDTVIGTTPVTDQQRKLSSVAHMTADGLVIIIPPSDPHYPLVSASNENRAWFVAKLNARFHGAVIHTWHTSRIFNPGSSDGISAYKLDEFKVTIPIQSIEGGENAVQDSGRAASST